MPHSNQLREFVLTDRGIELLDVYLGPNGVYAGSMRLNQEGATRSRGGGTEGRAGTETANHAAQAQAVESQVTAIRLNMESDEEKALAEIAAADAREKIMLEDRLRMAESRKSDAARSRLANEEHRS